MITPGEFIATLVVVGVGALWAGHFIGVRAGWCEGYTEGYDDAVEHSWAEHEALENPADYYGESEN